MDRKLLDILACPSCKGDIKYNKKKQELACCVCGVAYPIKDDIPIMLESEARKLSSDEVDALR